MLPSFGCKKQIWMVSDFVYFEFLAFETLCFGATYQAYHVGEVESARCHEICVYESLVDFSVLHIRTGRLDELYVPVKYDIDDLVEQHLQGTNPIKFL